MESTKLTHARFILKKDGYARLDETGKEHGEVAFDKGPLFEHLLQGSNDHSLTYEQVDTFMMVLAAKLELAFTAAARHGDSTEFGGAPFEEFLESPKLGELPVSESAIAIIDSLTCKTPINRGAAQPPPASRLRRASPARVDGDRTDSASVLAESVSTQGVFTVEDAFGRLLLST